MANKKLIQIATSVTIDSVTYFVGVRDNGDGTSNDYRYSKSELIDAILEYTKKTITVSGTGATVTDSWFDGKTISEIVTDRQAYLRNVDFTQSGDTITGTGISFYNGQIIVAKL